MLDPGQFRRLVVRPALQAIGLCSPAAERLLLGTALTESGLTWLAQKGGGPARGWSKLNKGPAKFPFSEGRLLATLLI